MGLHPQLLKSRPATRSLNLIIAHPGSFCPRLSHQAWSRTSERTSTGNLSSAHGLPVVMMVDCGAPPRLISIEKTGRPKSAGRIRTGARYACAPIAGTGYSTLILWRFARSTFGNVTSSKPSLNLAWAFSVLTSAGSARVRANAPVMVSDR
jgi:hypothetical protein